MPAVSVSDNYCHRPYVNEWKNHAMQEKSCKVLDIDGQEALVKFCRQAGANFTRPIVDDISWMPFSSLNPVVAPTLCPGRGRSQMRVYMKDKPVKWGIKLYELCESWSDYEWDFEIMAHEPGLSNAPFDICQRLIHSLKNAGYTLFIHNFYCNPALCDALAADNTMVVGTVPANPIGLPKDLIQQPMNKGDMDFRQKESSWPHCKATPPIPKKVECWNDIASAINAADPAGPRRDGRECKKNGHSWRLLEIEKESSWPHCKATPPIPKKVECWNDIASAINAADPAGPRRDGRECKKKWTMEDSKKSRKPKFSHYEIVKLLEAVGNRKRVVMATLQSNTTNSKKSGMLE
ncbi:hypothetical protein RRG08_011367 [Elysia crispata]|uniref:PiggyBac transposable element-derived protein domain-containing protein n=1 Tax=Elysia crispata TaxID=231223 RepID=A0AAE0ZMW9_9GAST|nr:hypothetical protein RRG08_011367 [Elysia crispata]